MSVQKFTTSVLKPSDKNFNSATFTDNITGEHVFDFSNVSALVVRISIDKKYWIVGLSNGVIQLFPIEDGDDISKTLLLKHEGEQLPCTDICCVPYIVGRSDARKSMIVAAYVSGCVRLWHYTGATPSSRLLATWVEERIARDEESDHPRRNSQLKTYNQVLTCSCSMDGLRFITAGEDCYIRVYDLKTRQIARLCHSSFNRDKMDGHVMRICSLKYHPRGQLHADYLHIFISGGWDDTIQIWDDRYLHSLWLYHGPHICGSDALDIEPETNQILSCSWRNDKALLQIWRFNEEIMAMFYSLAQESANNTFVLPSGTNLNTPSTTAIQYTRSIADIFQDTSESNSKGYVARWVGSHYIGFGGSGTNVLRILSRMSGNVISSVTNLAHGVYSLDYTESNLEDYRPLVTLAFASGYKVYVIRLEQK